MSSFYEMVLISLGLAADAFAASLCLSLSFSKVRLKNAVSVGLWFGIFQAMMPALGYFLGSITHGVIEKIDHWISFILLFSIGLSMIREAVCGGEANVSPASSPSPSQMLTLSFATSIDAFAAGIALAVSGGYSLLPSVFSIGTVTFVLSFIGVYIGSFFGGRSKGAATLFGGIILMGMGIRILCEHLG